MTLQDLLQQSGVVNEIPPEFSQIVVSGLSSDSRYAQKGDLFFAKKGAKAHGLDYLEALISTGVSAIIYEDPENQFPLLEEIPSLKVVEIDPLMRQLTFKFYEDLQSRIELIGVTGTEGKTSVTQFITKAFSALNIDCGLVGTNGIGFMGSLKENTHTTPDLMALYQSLAEIDKVDDVRVLLSGMLPIALEVTSHALDQKRVEGLKFKTTVFTNLNRDHLDYHGTIEAYGAAKARLFMEYDQENSVINIDDAFGEKLNQRLKEEKPAVTRFPYGTKNSDEANYLQIQNLKLHEKGLRFTLQYHGQQYPIESHLYGAFNAYNLVAAIGTLLTFGLSITDIIDSIPAITNVKGRMEMVHLNNGAVAVVDYAHKPNALKQALISLREHLDEGRLVSVFGCGGNRDTGKRPLMAEISEEFADQVIVTSDNPRFEDPLLIIKDIETGFKNRSSENIVIEADRAKAIALAIARSQKGDIILIAGKGHEDYQILGDREIYFSDFAEVQKNNEEL
ncbi:UDP-N-acetylmuramoyl-L-alanyl-D-glutamate--2,6-diaminopimelate ligase [Ignatzschineria rhizosphaerae]|uniref:UDP-N-acetylmuramoyl-L-alanyl-D-glutamate--2,6-diaminopimelate ligase n=1 Tax=Ignatzschineria rhizosphaerae TaxID=2923279 RepID=A0ABY3X444_9GAMM|nr:UDP-N-acetylmuramoyl-L-alanyl-D-glutamate--2,6-diaminopimelate ligase [Ignatzschineria rhizosphaerae]UNM96516.1 UDP-N-acetylmuramoyl-L-alanyl-D-glutamate--2,6-diaminopimelate ligase [Ignatzschineria rhizosphaerae]